VTTLLLLNAPLPLLLLRETADGPSQDKRRAAAPPSPLPAGSPLVPDLGFLAFTLPQVEIRMPLKKPRGHELTPAQKSANHALARRRVRIAPVNSSVQRCRILKDPLRLVKQGVRDLVMELCCALPNFRVHLTPWQPMISSR
jgi:DDE superfamily endonuclease